LDAHNSDLDVRSKSIQIFSKTAITELIAAHYETSDAIISTGLAVTPPSDALNVAKSALRRMALELRSCQSLRSEVQVVEPSKRKIDFQPKD
jgi:hypothetical protein